MNFSLKQVLASAVLSVGLVQSAHAASFLNLQVEGSLTQGGPYLSSLVVLPGETVYYEVTGVLAGAGTHNSTKNYTINANGENAGTDGINTIGLDLTNSDSSVSGITSTVDASSGYTAQGPTITSNGTDAGSTVTGVFAAQSAGTFVAATAPLDIFSGSFVAGSAATDTVSAAYSVSVAAGGIRVATTTNPSQTISLTVANSGPSAADPYVGDTALTLTEATVSSVPTPGIVPACTVFMSGIGAFGMLRRRSSAQV